MRIRKPIIIFTNRRKTKKHRVKSIGKNKNQREQAATMENTNDKQVPVYERYHTTKHKRSGYRHFSNKLKNSNHLKIIVIAVISAIVIGTSLGFIMLNMFDGIGGGTNGVFGSSGVSTADANNEEKKGDKSTFSLEPLSAFVLQGGVFSGEDNASDWAQSFQKAGHPAMIWKRDNQFTLLAGIAAQEDRAKELAENFTDEDIYVKKWTTEEMDITVTDAESEWLKSFIDMWRNSVQMISKDSSLQMDEWKQLLDQFPEKAGELTTFQKQLQQSLNRIEKKDNQAAGQLFLLKQWLQYEKLGKAAK